MIKGLPDETVFKKVSIRLFLYSLNQLYLFDEYLNIIPEMEIENEETAIHDYINNNQEELYAILILLFQSIENFLKKEVCNESPYLIISTHPDLWKDRDFNSLHLHGFDSLLKIYSETKNKKINHIVLQNMNSLRKLRNSIVHGVHTEFLNPEEICNYIFIYLDNFWGNSWLNEIRPYIPYEEHSGSNTILLWRYFFLFKKYLKINNIKKLLDIKTNKFFACPECTHYNKCAYTIIDKCDLAYFLNSPKESNKILFCPICQNKFYVENHICTKNKSCSNNVVSSQDWGDFCLDCLSFIE
ncbi:hypothetical protein [Legionella spiritensis]|uniref:Uncharacterized protein n=1 Tax=Legionella spiritensis TaxID=452 RepID=A0A0W0YXG5_LEGSP|nr:hypothetical protein [Legionella spiritensis]KTD61572.1 hypothetical protein Lspi_2202 [Legionella spiritensis]SNV32404.1 Uncharacterised protein [Legionella spiritensis]